jgi:hypothetical protein
VAAVFKKTSRRRSEEWQKSTTPFCSKSAAIYELFCAFGRIIADAEFRNFADIDLRGWQRYNFFTRMTKFPLHFKARALCCLLLAMLALTAYAQEAEKPTANSRQAKYIGPGSCSASSCHGGIQPQSVTHVLQNEYSTWVIQDKHSKSFQSLQNPVSVRMAKILGLPRADTAEKCLACHALFVRPSEKGREFDLSDGVSCESCHGPASAWLGPHAVKNFARQQSVALGMYDTSNLIQRAEKCNSCHVGDGTKWVDHEMIAAGHPALVFDLDSYTAVEPPHWKLPEDPGAGARAWSVGQAVQLRDSLLQLARRASGAKGTVWPEYAELECFACHHSLGKTEDSWRQQRGYHNRAPGNPPWNTEHYSVFRVVAKDIDAAQSEKLEADLKQIYALTSALKSDAAEIASTAKSAAEISDALATRLNTMTFDRQRTGRLMHAITAEADSISNQGTRSAEQAAMSLESLFVAYYGTAAKQPATVKTALNGLFQQLENPSAYNGPRFAAQMRRVDAALREAQ